MHYTTLNKIREKGPCEDGWQKLLKHLGKTKADDEPLSMKTILESNGFKDALWCLYAVDDGKTVILFCCDVAERVLPIWNKNFEGKEKDKDAPRKTIETSRKYANGEGTGEEIDAAGRAAWDAAGDAARAACWAAWACAGDACWAAVAASWVVKAAAWNTACDAVRATGGEAAEIKEQEKLFVKYFCEEE